MKSSKKWLIVGLILIIAGVGFFIIILFPYLYFYTSTFALSRPNKAFSLAAPEENMNTEEPKNVTHQQYSKDNKILIPAIDVEMNIVEGPSEEVLSEGAWRYPYSATPEENGNMIITGHRFQFGKPHKRSFYLLHKLQQGDRITIIWNNHEYQYDVQELYEIEPDNMQIIQKGDEKQLTLYTCSPLFSTKRRLIVIAKPL